MMMVPLFLPFNADAHMRDLYILGSSLSCLTSKENVNADAEIAIDVDTICKIQHAKCNMQNTLCKMQKTLGKNQYA